MKKFSFLLVLLAIVTLAVTTTSAQTDLPECAGVTYGVEIPRPYIYNDEDGNLYYLSESETFNLSEKTLMKGFPFETFIFPGPSGKFAFTAKMMMPVGTTEVYNVYVLEERAGLFYIEQISELTSDFYQADPDPVWSADGSMLAYVAPDESGINRIYIARYRDEQWTSTELRTHDGARDRIYGPRWSATGYLLSFRLGDNNYVVDITEASAVGGGIAADMKVIVTEGEDEMTGPVFWFGETWVYFPYGIGEPGYRSYDSIRLYSLTGEGTRTMRFSPSIGLVSEVEIIWDGPTSAILELRQFLLDEGGAGYIMQTRRFAQVDFSSITGDCVVTQ